MEKMKTNFLFRVPKNSSNLETEKDQTLQPVERTPLLDFTIQALRKALMNGNIKPGERLDEASLCSSLNVSRSTIREAMRKLEEEGLIDRIPFRGTFVRQFALEEIHEINSLRGVLECYAVELIISKKIQDLSQLVEIIRQMEKITPAGTTGTAINLHISFHRAIFEIAGNNLLLDVWTTLSQQFLMALRLSQLSHFAHGEGSTLAKNHQEIIDAIAAGDISTAQKIIRSHVSDDGLEIVQIPLSSD
jgi:DNA-binding GntR family transcriptional regulator